MNRDQATAHFQLLNTANSYPRSVSFALYIISLFLTSFRDAILYLLFELIRQFLCVTGTKTSVVGHGRVGANSN